MKTLGDLEILCSLGVGRRCRAYLVQRQGRLLVAKVYRRSAVTRHASRHTEHLACFEFRRNLALRRIEGLAPFVAEPVDLLVVGQRQIFLQEYVDGVRLKHFCENATAFVRQELFTQLRGVVAQAHRAGHYDLDLHPDNLLIVECEPGMPRVVLYDFNKIPYHLAPPNALFGWMVMLGLIDPCDRDLRYLRKLRRRLLSRPWNRFLYSPFLLALPGQLEPLLAH